jgi:hypothetical protein
MRAYHKRGWSVSSVFQSAPQCSAAADDTHDEHFLLHEEHEAADATLRGRRRDGLRLKADDAAARAAADSGERASAVPATAYLGRRNP